VIINVGSGAGVEAYPGWEWVRREQAALNHITRTLAAELEGRAFAYPRLIGRHEHGHAPASRPGVVCRGFPDRKSAGAFDTSSKMGPATHASGSVVRRRRGIRAPLCLRLRRPTAATIQALDFRLPARLEHACRQSARLERDECG
jgi:hypothetical protein